MWGGINIASKVSESCGTYAPSICLGLIWWSDFRPWIPTRKTRVLNKWLSRPGARLKGLKRGKSQSRGRTFRIAAAPWTYGRVRQRIECLDRQSEAGVLGCRAHERTASASNEHAGVG